MTQAESGGYSVHLHLQHPVEEWCGYQSWDYKGAADSERGNKEEEV